MTAADLRVMNSLYAQYNRWAGICAACQRDTQEWQTARLKLIATAALLRDAYNFDSDLSVVQ